MNNKENWTKCAKEGDLVICVSNFSNRTIKKTYIISRHKRYTNVSSSDLFIPSDENDDEGHWLTPYMFSYFKWIGQSKLAKLLYGKN